MQISYRTYNSYHGIIGISLILYGIHYRAQGENTKRFLCLVQDHFVTQHVLEPTRAAKVLYIVLFSQK